MVLALTVLLGTSALHTLVLYFAPAINVVTASILWLLLYFLGFVGLMFSQGINWISWLVRYRILLVVLLLGTIVSVAWSVDPAVSAERTVHLLGSSVIAIYIGFMVPLLTILRVTAAALGFVMVASLGSALALPDMGIENYEGHLVWRGVLSSKNSLGFWSAISVLLFITLSDSVNTFMMRAVCWLMALVSLFVLIQSDSATSLLAMVVAGSLSLYLFIAFRFQLGFARMAVMAVLFIGLIGLIITNINTAELLGRSGDLTGRGEVWDQTWKLIMRQPLTGYGYGALWFPNDDTLWIQQRLTDFTWVVYHAHNGFLQVASEIGLPLSVIALLMVVQQLIEIFYCQYERQQVGVLFVLAFVITFLISNFSEARFLVNRELYWIFFLALPISMLRQITLVSGNPYEPEEEYESNLSRSARWDEDEEDDEPVATTDAQPNHGGRTNSFSEGAAGVAGAAASGAAIGKPWLDQQSRHGNADDDDEFIDDTISTDDLHSETLSDDLTGVEGFDLNEEFEPVDEAVEEITVNDPADIDLGEIVSEEPYDEFDEFDDDKYDRFGDED